MSIEYDFYKTNGALAKKQPYHVRVVEHNTIHSDELARRIQNRTTLTIPDIKGTLSALTEEMVAQLSTGNRVHIEGLGYFSLSIQGEVAMDKNNQLKLKHPSVRSIRFLPEEQMINKLKDTSFSCQHHKGCASKEHDTQSIKDIVDALLARDTFFTPNDFFKAAHLTRSTGYRILKTLLDNHYLENIGTPSHHLLAKAQKQMTNE